jgi:hypothetical protein
VRLLALVIPVLMLGHSAPPKDGEELVRQMHDRYAGKWYHNLTFKQTTSFPGMPAVRWLLGVLFRGKLGIDLARV